MSTIEISIQIPKELVEKVSTAAQFTEKTRDEIVAEALREHFPSAEFEDEVKRELFDQYLEGEVSVGTLNHFLDKDAKELENFATVLSTQEKESIGISTEE